MRALLFITFVVGCSAPRAPSEPETKPAQIAPTPSPTTRTKTTEVDATAKPDAAPAPDAGLKNCCDLKCNADEQFAWEECNGSDLANKIADEWQGLISGFKYPEGSATKALKTANVLVPKAGAEVHPCDGTEGGPPCVYVYPDEQAARRSCVTSEWASVPFTSIAKQAAANKQSILVVCHQFFKSVIEADLTEYTTP